MSTEARTSRAKKTVPRKASRAAEAAPRKTAGAKKSPPKKTVARSGRAPSTDGSEVGERLAKYRAMRDFARTPEPQGSAREALPATRSFVVQKHAASHLHYDFRLELDGVLLSWSIPKGPSLRPGDRRLAIRTEDHPLEYADFEGIIPKGEYGGGTVIVWDHGSWLPEGDPQEAMARGKLSFALLGEKLSGRFHLARTKGEQGKEHWLLFKSRDAFAREGSDIVAERPESAVSGRTIEQVASDPERVWHSNRPEKRAASAAPRREKGARGASEGGAQGDMVELVKRLPLPFPLTNLDKVLYPEQNLRKAELIAYYAAIASHALPYLGGRPLMLVRCPHGRQQKCFFQKHANEGVPAAVVRVDIREGDKVERCMVVRDLAGLVALAQLGALEVHTWMCHAESVEQPDQLVLDLDPDEGLGWTQVVEAALAVRARLADVGLESFVKTTGGKGLHVVAPVARKLDWDEHKSVARAIAESIARERPDRYVTSMRKSLRAGKLFLDYFRNGRGATAIAPYSTRAREGATVAAPLTWQELESGAHPRDFSVYSLTTRLRERRVDPWKGFTESKQALRPAALRVLGIRR